MVFYLILRGFLWFFVSFVQGDATRNHWVIFGGQNLALQNKGFLHLTGEICIIYIQFIYTHKHNSKLLLEVPVLIS